MRMGRTRTTRTDLPRRVYFHHNAFYFIDKAGKRHPLGREFGEAMAKYAAIAQPVIGKMRIGAVMDEYIKTTIPTKKPRTQEDYLGAIARLRPVFGDMWPEDLEPHHIYSYLDMRAGKTQANREIAALSNVMTLAIRKGLVSANPCKQVRRNPESPGDREVTDVELAAFRPFCPGWIQAYLDLKDLIGLRQGDMLRLSRFALRDDGLFCLTGKRDKRILFKWSPALRAAVDACLALRRKPSESRFFPITARGFKSAWSRAMHKYQPEKIELRFAENDLRAKVATEAMDLGMDATSMMGHSSDTVTRRHYIRGTRKVSPLR